MRVWLLSALIIAGCEKQSEPCDLGPTSLQATFLGGAYGKGRIELSPGAELIDARLVLDRAEGRSGEGAVLELAGRGVCRDGLVRIDLGGGSSGDGKMRVLGGTIIVVLARPELVDQPFGTWRAEIDSSEWDAPRRLEGPWIASSESPESRNVAAR